MGEDMSVGFVVVRSMVWEDRHGTAAHRGMVVCLAVFGSLVAVRGVAL